MRATYGAAQAQTQGYETAMANRLQTMGLDTAQDVQGQFAQAGMPEQTAALSQGVAQEAAGGFAGFASRSARTALQRLAAEGAAQASHAAALPGVAHLAGRRRWRR